MSRPNPRRREQLTRLLEHLALHGAKLIRAPGVPLPPGFDEPAMDRSIDDAYALGLIDLVEAGGGFSVRLLSTDIEAALAHKRRR